MANEIDADVELLTDPQGARLLQLGVTRFLELQKSADFPRPVWLGPRGKRHNRAELLAWAAAQRQRPPEASAPASRADRDLPKARRAAALLGCALARDLSADQAAVWQAAGRPGRVEMGIFEFVTQRELAKLGIKAAAGGKVDA